MNDSNKENGAFKLEEADKRIYSILTSVRDNIEDLKTPVTSILEHVHQLGITGNEDTEEIKKACIKTLDYFKESSGHVAGIVDDSKKISGVLKRMFGW